MQDSFKLCYIHDNWAWFTTAPLEQQWGDDWDDSPYEHNAGNPYQWHERFLTYEPPIPEYQLLKIPFTGPYLEPKSTPFFENSYSVYNINRKFVPWLYPDPWYPGHENMPLIWAGTTLIEFVRIITSNNGKLYIDPTDPATFIADWEELLEGKTR